MRCSSRRSSARCRTKPSSRPSLTRSLERGAHLRGFPRPAAHVQPGADVPDRRAHPVGHGVGRAGRRRLCAARRRRDPRAAPQRSRTRSPKTTAASGGQQTALLALGKLGGREMTATSDLDLIIVYDFDAGASAIRRRAAALRRAIFRAADPAADQRAVVADQLRRALSGRHAAAPLRPLRAGRDQHRRLRELPGDRSLDLGAHGADAGAGGVGLARLSRAGSRR